MKLVPNAKAEAVVAADVHTVAAVVVAGAAAMAVVVAADAAAVVVVTEATAADTAATANCGIPLTIEGSLWVAASAATIADLRPNGFSR